MAWKRKRGDRVRQIKRAIQWCRKGRALKGGESRLREAERLLRELLTGIDDAQAESKLLHCLGVFAEVLGEIR